jgi:hypothetical protein
MASLSACLCVVCVNFSMHEPVFMELGIHLSWRLTPSQRRTSCIPAASLCLLKRYRGNNTLAKIEELLDTSIPVLPRRVNESKRLCCCRTSLGPVGLVTLQ